MNENKIRNATSLDIDGHKFKSKLEAYCYKRLKEEGIEGEYEKHIFTLQPAFEFEGDSYEMYKTKGTKEFAKAKTNIRPITYKPDFVNVEDNWVIECKGYPNDSFPLKWKMFKYYLDNTSSENITLYMPRNQHQIDDVIELIKQKKMDRLTETFIKDITPPIVPLTEEQADLIFRLLNTSSYTEDEQVDLMKGISTGEFSIEEANDLISNLQINQLDALDKENYNQKAFMRTNKF